MALTKGELRLQLDRIAANNDGVLLPGHIVAEAQDPSSPLHLEFNWNDADVAYSARVEHARRLIARVRVEIRVEERVLRPVPYFVEHPRKASVHEQGYLALSRVRSDTEMAVAVVAQEFARALAALERARNVASALGMSEDIDDMITRLQRLSKAIPTLKVA